MDTEGKKITEEEQLGLLLYRAGAVCGLSDFKAADAICRYMNYTRASRWTNTKDSDFVLWKNYDTRMNNVECSGTEWESCSYSEVSSCWDGYGRRVYLSCSGTIMALRC